jgi:hypothetical protein
LLFTEAAAAFKDDIGRAALKGKNAEREEEEEEDERILEVVVVASFFWPPTKKRGARREEEEEEEFAAGEVKQRVFVVARRKRIALSRIHATTARK